MPIVTKAMTSLILGAVFVMNLAFQQFTPSPIQIKGDQLFYQLSEGKEVVLYMDEEKNINKARITYKRNGDNVEFIIEHDGELSDFDQDLIKDIRNETKELNSTFGKKILGNKTVRKINGFFNMIHDKRIATKGKLKKAYER